MPTNGINEIRGKKRTVFRCLSPPERRTDTGRVQTRQACAQRRRFFMKTQSQKPDADAGRCKDEALQRAPRQIQEQFQHRMVPLPCSIGNAGPDAPKACCRKGRMYGLAVLNFLPDPGSEQQRHQIQRQPACHKQREQEHSARRSLLLRDCRQQQRKRAHGKIASPEAPAAEAPMPGSSRSAKAQTHR